MNYFTKQNARGVLMLTVASLGSLAAFSGCGPSASQPSGAMIQESMQSDGMMKPDGMMKSDGMMKDGAAPAGPDMKSDKKM